MAWPEPLKCQSCGETTSALYLIKATHGPEARLLAWLTVLAIARAHTTAPPFDAKNDPHDIKLTHNDRDYLSRMRNELYDIFLEHGLHICYSEWACRVVHLNELTLTLLKYDKTHWKRVDHSTRGPGSVINDLNPSTNVEFISCLTAAAQRFDPPNSPRPVVSNVANICTQVHIDKGNAFQGRPRAQAPTTAPIINLDYDRWNLTSQRLKSPTSGKDTKVAAVGIPYKLYPLNIPGLWPTSVRTDEDRTPTQYTTILTSK